MGEQGVTAAAAAVETAAESLVQLLDDVRLAHPPAVPPAQLRLLGLAAADPQVTMGGLAGALGVVPSAVSRLCDRLEAAGLLSRVSDPRDRREVRVQLTAAGRDLLEALRERRRAALATVLRRMPPDDRAALVRSTRAFAAAAGAAAADRARRTA